MPPARRRSFKALTAVLTLSPLILPAAEAANWNYAMSWKKLDDGLDPECSVKKDGKDCKLKSVPLVSGMECSPGEKRCFVPSNDKDGDHRMLTSPREKDRPYLFAWTHARVLASLGLLTVAYQRTGTADPEYAIVPRKLWKLDSFPDPAKTDPSYGDGFKTKNDLRLVLRPSALRLMWWGILDELVAIWQHDAVSILQGGELLTGDGAGWRIKLDSLCCHHYECDTWWKLSEGYHVPRSPFFCTSLLDVMYEWSVLTRIDERFDAPKQNLWETEAERIQRSGIPSHPNYPREYHSESQAHKEWEKKCQAFDQQQRQAANWDPHPRAIHHGGTSGCSKRSYFQRWTEKDMSSEVLEVFRNLQAPPQTYHPEHVDQCAHVLLDGTGDGTGLDRYAECIDIRI